MMKHASLATMFFLVVSGLVFPAHAASKFEAVAIPGSPKTTGALFRIEIATGKVADVWGSGPAFTAVPETAALPPGEYHLYLTSDPQTDGSVPWTLSRIDVNSGRTWVLTGGGSAPFAWVEIQEPK